MLDCSRRGTRGPAPSWRLGSTRTIRVPIVLADVLLKLARKIDSGELTFVDLPTTLDKQELPQNLTDSNDQQHD